MSMNQNETTAMVSEKTIQDTQPALTNKELFRT